LLKKIAQLQSDDAACTAGPTSVSQPRARSLWRAIGIDVFAKAVNALR